MSAILRMNKDEAELEKTRLEAAKLEHEYTWQIARDAKRVYEFNDMVCDGAVEGAINTMTRWLAYDFDAPITLVLNSPGGGIFSGFALYDFILDVNGRGGTVDTLVRGYAASMAGALLQAGSTRTMMPNSYLMIHEASTVIRGAASSIRDEVELLHAMQDRVITIMASRSHMSKAEIEERTERRDWWLNAEESLQLGFIDEIRAPGSVT